MDDKKKRSENKIMIRRRSSRTLEAATPKSETRVSEGIDGYHSLVDEMRRLYAEGEVEAALDIAATVRPEALAFSLGAVPKVAMTTSELRKLPLDHRAGFLLGRIDGRMDLRTVLDIAAMPISEATGILEELLELGAIRLVRAGAISARSDASAPTIVTPSPSPPAL